MDPPDSQSQEQEAPKKNGVVFVILRWILAILFPFLLFLSIPFLLGLLVLMFADFSIPNPISLPSQCKIVSTGVDIRSSKICELGLLDYKAKDVFHHFERSKFRCRYDYYWASVFKVEYKDHFSGQTQVAFAEAPNEALPLYCRPNFGAAWLTQYKFKVNETYDCWYTSGISKVRLHQDSLFGCDAHEQSTLEKSRQYSTMAMEMVISWFSSRGRTKHWRWETLAGVVTGFKVVALFCCEYDGGGSSGYKTQVKVPTLSTDSWRIQVFSSVPPLDEAGRFMSGSVNCWHSS
ncbi:hypothetical protein JHK82_025795 [Glycine max]|nr:hypothetical protein JHK82_025795 [Glycine max]